MGDIQTKPLIFDKEAKDAYKALHNAHGKCPICSAEGTFDTLTPAGTLLPPETNWIWYNPFVNSWECGECWLK